MKYYSHLVNFLIIFIFFNKSACLPNIREFLVEFLNAANSKEKSITQSLSKNCLGKLSEYYIESIIKSYRENNFDNLIKNVENLGIDIFLNCPSESVFDVFMDFDDSLITDFTSAIKSPKKIKSLITLLYSLYFDELSPSSLGKAFGDTINLFKKSDSQIEDSAEKMDKIDYSKLPFFSDLKKEYAFEFLLGMLNGLKKEDDGKDSDCYKDIIKGKDKIYKYIVDAYDSMDKGKDFSKAFGNIIFNLITVEGFVSDCNLLDFGSLIAKVSSAEKLKELWKKSKNQSQFYLYNSKELVKNMQNGDYKEAGKYFGKIFGKIFDFSVK